MLSRTKVQELKNLIAKIQKGLDEIRKRGEEDARAGLVPRKVVWHDFGGVPRHSHGDGRRRTDTEETRVTRTKVVLHDIFRSNPRRRTPMLRTRRNPFHTTFLCEDFPCYTNFSRTALPIL